MIRITVVIFVLFLSGCGINDNHKLVKKIVNDKTGDYSEFYYSNMNLDSIVGYSGDSVSGKTIFIYKEGLLIVVKNPSILYIAPLPGALASTKSPEIETFIAYDSNGRKSSERTVIHLNGEIFNELIDQFDYGENGILRSKTTADSSVNFYNKTSYRWKDGNLVEMNYRFLPMFGDTLELTTLFKYDNNINYSHGKAAFVYLDAQYGETALSKNNLVAIEMSPIDSLNSGRHYIYEYDELGYPTQYAEINGERRETYKLEY